MPSILENIPGARNYLHNGNFDIWQRGTSFAAGNTYKADRWYIHNNAGSTQARTSSDLTNSTYFFRFTMTSGTNSGYLTQSLENINLVPIQGKTVTFSCYLRASVAASGVLLGIAKSTSSNVNYGTGSWTNINTSSVSVTTSWQKFSVTATIPADGTANGLTLAVFLPSNLTNASTFDIAQCMLNEGPGPAPFQTSGSSNQHELAMCQRYYEPIIGASTVSLNATRVSSVAVRAFKKFVVQKRSTGTIVYPGTTAPGYSNGASPTGNNISFFDYNAGIYMTINTATGIAYNIWTNDTSLLQIEALISGGSPIWSGTSGQTCIMESGASVNMGLDCEL